jgi:hypothetical protein
VPTFSKDYGEILIPVTEHHADQKLKGMKAGSGNESQ